jgi:biotin carboxyl carrier protein
VSDLEALIDDEQVVPDGSWQVVWDDRERGVARLVGADAVITVLVEGSGTQWVVTVRGRRIPVTVRTWRERLLAEAERTASSHTGPVTVKATLPGLIAAVRVAAGDEVAQGDPLLTIEAMKMQNEVRAPRGARVASVAVAAGDVVSTGAVLVTLE